MKLNGQEMYLFIGGQYDSHQVALDGMSDADREAYVGGYRPVELRLGTQHTIVYVVNDLTEFQAFEMLRDRYHDTARK